MLNTQETRRRRQSKPTLDPYGDHTRPLSAAGSAALRRLESNGTSVSPVNRLMPSTPPRKRYMRPYAAPLPKLWRRALRVSRGYTLFGIVAALCLAIYTVMRQTQRSPLLPIVLEHPLANHPVHSARKEFWGPIGADFGGIWFDTLRFLPNYYYRIIDRAAVRWYNDEKAAQLEEMDVDMDEGYEHYEDLDFPRPGCHRLKWTHESHPTCNHFHELPLGREPSLLQPFRERYLAHGSFRDTWMFEPDNDDPKLVLKALRLAEEAEVDFDWTHGFYIFKEALIMERTSASSRTMNVYGHCYTSMLVEAGYEISQRISAGVEYEGRGRITKENLEALQADGVVSFNNFTAEEKLDMALAMAEGIALMHGHEEGVILNDDVHPDQWLRNKEGLVKFNDFNNAKVLEWNPETRAYCKFRDWVGGDYRSPEELRVEFIDEKSDVWPMGANMFTLLTGLFPYYEIWDRYEIEKIIADGNKPYLDPRWKTRSYIEGRMVEIMEECWEVVPEDRVSIFEVVAHLRETKAVAEERKKTGDVDWDLEHHRTMSLEDVPHVDEHDDDRGL